MAVEMLLMRAREREKDAMNDVLIEKNKDERAI
jgi:hypothetical protein